MKQGPLINLIAYTLTQPEGSVRLYARELREAGLLTTGARGVNAPHMTPLDAARLILALLVTDKPSECVERVRRFGPLKYSPGRKCYAWQEVIQPEEFHTTFLGETLEEVIANIIDLPARLGVTDACGWFNDNAFHLRVNDFDVMADLHRWRMKDGSVVGERIVPFKADTMLKGDHGLYRHSEGFTPIKGGIRTERLMTCGGFSMIGLAMFFDQNPP